MKKIILNAVLATTLMSCASTKTTRQEKIAEFKYITEEICPKTPAEIALVQHLYNEMINN
tara:strand:- start:102 stop:281 length:180 start_codon:yes stop_codon:yes gene_type:complete